MNTLSRRAGLVMVGLCLLGAAASAATDDFNASMDVAMMRMHAAMARPGTGDPDHDFAIMMIPHHQGAVEMAEAELRFGRDPVLRRLAQGIIVEQRQEISVMRQALGESTPAAVPAASMHHGAH